MDKNNVAWVTIGGSIFTRDKVSLKTPSRTIQVQESIAFNLKQEIAEHIVALHNDSLRLREPQ